MENKTQTLNEMLEVEKIINICHSNNIDNITGSHFKKNSIELEKTIKMCEKYKIPKEGIVFYRTAEEVEEIIKICASNAIIPITTKPKLSISKCRCNRL